MEQSISEVVSRHPVAGMTVLYPGRLVEHRSVAHPGSLLQTRYDRLAGMMIRAGGSGRPSGAVIGLDARLWLGFRGLVSALEAVGLGRS